MAATDIKVTVDDSAARATEQLLAHLRRIRNLDIVSSYNSDASLPAEGLLNQLLSLSSILSSHGRNREAETLKEVRSLSALSTNYGGLGLGPSKPLSTSEETSVLFCVSAWLEALNSVDRARSPPAPLTSRPEGRSGMTLSEKIFAAHDVEGRGELKPGDMVRVNVDWIMTSELSWNGMERCYNALGKPGIFRNDRFWLAGDHMVDPRIKDNPKIQRFVEASERARDTFKITEYQGMNYTIMHTEFSRERAQPGMIVIGSDSHTCSAGSVGALAIGLGVADVTLPLITGETWFRVPESINIEFINAPSPGIGGKDIILYILKELKRNTVAADRVVEFTGPGLEFLSCDARFAICNMCTEFGAITGIFAPDQVTFDFINHRKLSRNKKHATYFKPDEDAVYSSTHTIDLAKVESFVAVYPNPDNVVPVGEVEDKNLDGCFIGACTTAEEDLVIGAMVLEIGMQKGLSPVTSGKRRVVPGSLPIRSKLEKLGFLNVYEKAGFDVGVPDCSYCVGMGADKAGEGEIWLSSQNRNFENRMGKGSIGSLASAVTVAASSLRMKITDPRPFLEEIDQDRLHDILGYRPKSASTSSPIYVEPNDHEREKSTEQIGGMPTDTTSSKFGEEAALVNAPIISEIEPAPSNYLIQGRVQRLGDFIDTDALSPSDALASCTTDSEFGMHCLKYTHPSFRSRAQSGDTIVVAGKAFRVRQLARNSPKSFGFIFGRNMPNLGLLGIVIADETFYEVAGDGESVVVDLAGRRVRVVRSDGEGGVKGEWSFELSQMEKELIAVGGLTNAFMKFGKGLFSVMCAPKGQKGAKRGIRKDESCGTVGELQW